MADVTYFLAADTASLRDMPLARFAAIADANVQPVPCVLVLSMRCDVKALYSVPS